MPSQYPAALDNLPATFAGTDQADVVDHAGMHNAERQAINAVQAELGTDPSGAAATVRARLDAIDADSRWTNSRTPSAHKTSHAIGGSDPLTPADIGAATAAQGSLADTAVQPTIGTGSPEGVRAASPGATWIQTDHPVGGVLVWRKITGFGTSGWRVVEGETQTFDVASLHAGMTWGTVNVFKLRRVGSIVEIYLDVTATTPASGINALLTRHLGFEPTMPSNHDDVIIDTLGTTTATLLMRQGAPFSIYRIPAPPNGTRFRATKTFTCSDAWPGVAPL